MRIGIAQAGSVVLDLAGSIDKACGLVAEAGKQSVELLAFPEAFLPCYPLWCDTGIYGSWDHEHAKRLHARLMRNSIEVPSPELEHLQEAARAAGVAAVIGANERAGGSLYNTLLFISNEGELLGRHRKLVPTHGERLIWGRGDAVGLKSYRMANASVTGLVCWEHWMPLARHVLHAAGEELHVAAWPHGKERHQLASRHYAFEGRCYVLAAATYMLRSDLPEDFELPEAFANEPDVLIDGGSAVIGPDGKYVVEPVCGREELIVRDLDMNRVAEERATLDVAGHYSRPDLFDLRVRREPLDQVRFDEGGE